MGDELKPCPFCGTPARYVEDSDHHGAWFNLGCGSAVPDQGEPCPAHYAFYTCDMSERDAAIAAWNTRAQAPAPGEAVASSDVLERLARLLCRQHYGDRGLSATGIHNVVESDWQAWSPKAEEVLALIAATPREA